MPRPAVAPRLRPAPPPRRIGALIKRRAVRQLSPGSAFLDSDLSRLSDRRISVALRALHAIGYAEPRRG